MFLEDRVQGVGAHEESENLIIFVGLKLGPNILKIVFENAILMHNKRMAAQLASHPLRSMPSFTSGQIRKWHQRQHLEDL